MWLDEVLRRKNCVSFTFKCLWMWQAISNMSSEWTASISFLKRDKAKIEGLMEEQNKRIFKTISLLRNHAHFLNKLTRETITQQSKLQSKQLFPTFALEKQIRHRQALSWASSLSKLSVSFL